MTIAPQESQSAFQEQNQDKKVNDKELNFRAQQQKYEKLLAEERAARLEAERIAQERSKTSQDDEEDDEPYIDRKKLDKKLAKFGEQTYKQTQSDIDRAVKSAISEERKQSWLKQNNDFYDVMQHAEKLAQQDPELAETILEMPEGFDRQKLVYKNIKALGLHRPAQKEVSIQEKIDSNKRSPFYQPTGISSAPYSQAGDFSEAGKKQAYEKMKELKDRLRI